MLRLAGALSRPIRDEALDSGLLNPKNLGVNIKTLLYQVPGGMLSNLTSQLKEQHAEDKFYDVLEEVPRVRKDLGEPPLVTPSSQIVGTQAVFNVLMGERYKMVTKETKDILSGKYGATVKPFDPEVPKNCIGDTEPITCRPADLIENELDKLEGEIARYRSRMRMFFLMPSSRRLLLSSSNTVRHRRQRLPKQQQTQKTELIRYNIT